MGGHVFTHNLMVKQIWKIQGKVFSSQTLLADENQENLWQGWLAT